MLTETNGLFARVWFLLCGNNSFNALGDISVLVTMKKINNRNTMSVIDDMLNPDSILFRRLMDIMD